MAASNTTQVVSGLEAGDEPRLPLEGIRVIDLTRNLAGPFCTMRLGDMGAEVIKIESPNGGDELRKLFRFPGRAEDTEDYFGLYNRNKRSLVLDLKSKEGKKVFWSLVEKSDVFIQNLSPGAVDRLGFSYEAMRSVNERMVYVNISGFGGEDGRKAYDGVVQAASGIMDMTGVADGPPSLCGIAVGDLQAALFSAFATVNGLMLAGRTGIGMEIEVPMMDCLLAVQTGVAAEYLATGEGGRRMGAESPHRVPHNIYPTSDGSYVFLVSNNEIWPRLCEGLELDEAADDPRFKTNQDRVAHRAAVNELLSRRISQLSCADICKRLEAAGVPHSPVATFPEVMDTDYVVKREMVATIEGEQRDGREPIRVMGRPYKMKGGPPLVRVGPPRLGEANDYVLHELLGFPES
jgi:crotonobetainyl-CoA:carnitine CoA-transferase CaiB-like acyl-CoA transferase